MIDVRDNLVAGGIVGEAHAVKGLDTSPLEARSYAHPALVGRTVVRLTSAAIGDATDVEMNVLGFAAPTTKRVVGKSLLRALGFPAWAVVHDPKHARFALEVMQEFRKAARKIRSKPGFARDELAAIAKRLQRSVPHFLPSFWEEAGRAFITEGSTTFGAQCFEKARSAEKEFKLKVDEDQRSRSYLEFALAGAVATKSLTGYADDLQAAFGAKDGYRRFFDLAVQRTRGGVAPWSSMAKDLRRLAKAAGVDAADADRDLIAAVIDAPSLAQAPLEFWTAYRPHLVTMAKADPQVRARVRHLFPKPPNHQKLTHEWLSILEECGASDAFVVGHPDAGAEPPGAAAGWIDRLVPYMRNVGWRGTDQPASKELLALLTKVAPRVIAEGVPAKLASSDGYWRSLDLDVLEHTLALGIPVVEPVASRTSIDLNTPFALDPVHVDAHPAFSKLLVEAIDDVFGEPEFEQRAAGKRGLANARRTWLDQQIATAQAGGLPSLRTGLNTLEEKTSSATFAEFPESHALLTAFDAALCLRMTLAGGLLDELGWPAMEEVLASATTPKKPAELHGTVRHPIVRAGTKVFVFDGAERHVELSVPSSFKQVESITFVAGALLVIYVDGSWDRHAAWSTSFKSPFEPKNGVGVCAAAAVLPDGSLTLGGRAIHPGDQTVDEIADLVADGTTFWRATRPGWNEPIVCTEFDPRTGQKGRASWPSFVEPSTRIDDGLRMDALRLLPAPPGSERSPLGNANGLVGWYRRSKPGGDENPSEVVRVDGVRWTGPTAPWGLLTLPGSDEPRPIYASIGYATERLDSITIGFEGHVASSYGPSDEDDEDESWSHVGFAPNVRAGWLHYMRPRDEAGSRALRAITRDQCADLLAACADTSDRDAMRARVDESVKRVLPEITHPHVVTAVTRAVLLARALVDKLDTVRGSGSGPRHEAVDDDSLADALPIATRSGWVDGPFAATLHTAAQFLLHGEERPMKPSSTDWEGVLPHFGRALAYFATRDTVADEARVWLVRALRAYLDSGLASGATLRRATITAKKGAPILEGMDDEAMKLYREGTSRYVVRPLEDREDDNQLRILEAFEGKPQLPAKTTLDESTEIVVPDERALLEDVLTTLEARGPVPYQKEDAEALARLTGMDAARAKLMIAGLPKMRVYAADFLGRELRERLGVKMQEAKAVKAALEGQPALVVYEIVGAALSGITNAAQLYETSTAETPSSWVSALATGARETSGKRVEHRAELVAELKRYLGWRGQPEDVLSALVDPRAKALKLCTVAPAAIWRHEADRDTDPSVFLTAFAKMASHLALTLPAGDPYREGLSAAHAVLRAQLADTSTILPMEQLSLSFDDKKRRDKALERIGGDPIDVPRGKDKVAAARDNGAIIAVSESEYSIEIFLRPAALLDSKRKAAVAILEALLAEQETSEGTQALAAVRCLMSDAFGALASYIARAITPPGLHDADPRLTANKQLSKLKKHLGLGEDEATLYLQLASLPAPTDKFLLAVNGWTQPKLDAAGAALAKAGLVLEAKRERAGRKYFLPGGWEKRSGPELPFETWKIPLYPTLGAPFVAEPAGALFARVVERILSGDVPRFESVSAVRATKGKKK